MKKMRLPYILFAMLSSMSYGVYAQSAQNAHAGHAGHTMPEKTQSKIYSARGTLEKIDSTAKKLTIRHEPIVALNWPTMTMSFALADPHLMDGLKIKDKLRFELRMDGNNAVITDIEVVK